MSTEGPVTICVEPSSPPGADEARDVDPTTAGLRAPDLPGAITLARSLRSGGRRVPVRIVLEDGAHLLPETVELDARDADLTIAARNPGAAEIHASWTPAALTESVDEAGRVWAAELPDDVRRAVEVNGRAASIARSPEDGYHRVAHAESVDFERGFDALFAGDERFRFAPESLPDLPVPAEVDLIVPHFWVQERARVTDVDASTGTLTFEPASIFALRDEKPGEFARFALENVRDAFRRPGQFYIDETGSSPWALASGRPALLYRPFDDEDLETSTVRLPRNDTALRLSSVEAVTGFALEGIRFTGFAPARTSPAVPPFRVSEDARLTRDGYATSPQGAPEVPAVVELGVARDAAITDCVFEGVGGWAIGIAAPAAGILIADCRFLHIGAGAVVARISPGHRDAAVFRLAIERTEIREAGRRYPHAPAIFLQDAEEARVVGNLIADTHYSGVSVGWSWGFEANASRGNLIEGNVIDGVGSGALSDLGGIYTLGSQPGSRIVGNRISRVRTAHYGGWGIYLDEGSSHILVAGNTCLDLDEHALNVHYGAHLEIRDNTFAFGGLGLVSVSRPDRSDDITITGNTFLTLGTPVYTGRPELSVLSAPVAAHGNRMWDVAGTPTIAADLGADGAILDRSAEWVARGNDTDALAPAYLGVTDVIPRDRAH